METWENFKNLKLQIRLQKDHDFRVISLLHQLCKQTFVGAFS